MTTYRSGAKKSESQKVVTKDYKENWDKIWGKKKEEVKDDPEKNNTIS